MSLFAVFASYEEKIKAAVVDAAAAVASVIRLRGGTQENKLFYTTR